LREKLNLYRRFGSKLGAKSIQTTLKLTKSEKIEIESDGKVTFKVVKTDVNVKNQIESNYRNSLEIKEEYQQQENFDLFKNIDELKTIIKENNLGYETELIELIEGRDSRNSGTSLISREVKSEISSEYNKLLEISADVTAPTFSISTNFKNRFESVNTLSIEIKYEF
jgi:hypothetical protein